jgi:ferrochelatase
LRASGVRSVLVLPALSAVLLATTGSVFDALSAELRRWRWCRRCV